MQPLNDLRKAGGQLLDVGTDMSQTQEDVLQKQATKLGTVTPTSPLGAAGIGVSSDTAKMAGTPTQKLGTIARAAGPTEKGFGDTKSATDAQKQSLAEAEKLKGLTSGSGNLDSRVDSIVKKNIQAATTALQDTNSDTLRNGLISKMGITDPKQQSLMVQLMKSPNAVTADDQTWKALGTRLGVPDVNSLTTQGLTDAISLKLQNVLAQDIQSKVTVGQMDDEQGDAFWQSVGFSNAKDVESFLGGNISLDQLTVKQFNDLIQQKVSANFSSVQAQMAILNDPSASSQEKEAARRQLQDLSGTGIEAAESFAAKAPGALKGAETITFNGKEYDPNSLFQSSDFLDAAKNYYAAINAPTPDTAAISKMEASLGPDVVAYLKANKAFIGTQIGTAKEALTKTEGNTGATKAYYTNTGLAPSILKAAFDVDTSAGFGQLQAVPDKVKNSGLMKLLSNPAFKGDGMNIIKDLEGMSAESQKLLLNMTEQDMLKKGINPNASPRDIWAAMKSYEKDDRTFRQIAAIKDTDKIWEVLGLDSRDIQNTVNELANAYKLGKLGPEEKAFMDMFDSNRDGKIDSTLALRNRFVRMTDISHWSPDKSLSAKFDKLLTKPKETAKQIANLPPGLKDGSIDEADTNGMDTGQIEDLINKNPTIKVAPQLREKVNFAHDLDAIKPVEDAVNLDLRKYNALENIDKPEYGDFDNVQNSLNDLESKYQDLLKARDAALKIPMSSQAGSSRREELLKKYNNLISASQLKLSAMQDSLNKARGNLGWRDRTEEGRAAASAHNLLTDIANDVKSGGGGATSYVKEKAGSVVKTYKRAMGSR